MTTIFELSNSRADTCVVVDQYSATDYAVTLYRGSVPGDRKLLDRRSFTAETAAIAHAVLTC